VDRRYASVFLTWLVYAGRLLGRDLTDLVVARVSWCRLQHQGDNQAYSQHYERYDRHYRNLSASGGFAVSTGVTIVCISHGLRINSAMVS